MVLLLREKAASLASWRDGSDFFTSIPARCIARTWHILQNGIEPRDQTAVERKISESSIVCDVNERAARILIDGVDPAAHLRDDKVNRNVSLVSSFPRVREVLVEKMRTYAADYDLVMEGRDIGSVVFSETPFKFYIDASPEIRSQRRAAQGQHDEIAIRDLADSSRSTSPLVIAKDAVVIDTSTLTIPQVVDEIVSRLRSKGLQIQSHS